VTTQCKSFPLPFGNSHQHAIATNLTWGTGTNQKGAPLSIDHFVSNLIGFALFLQRKQSFASICEQSCNTFATKRMQKRKEDASSSKNHVEIILILLFVLSSLIIDLSSLCSLATDAIPCVKEWTRDDGR
jgi:hypothetical protein